MAQRDDQKAQDQARREAGVATAAENDKLEHSAADRQVSGADASAPETTRDDAHDLGVPMVQGDPREPTGPEDALGEGPTRGDYSQRAGAALGERPHTSAPVEGGGEPILDDDGNVVDFKPLSEVVPQAQRATEQGKVPVGTKGGVDSAS